MYTKYVLLINQLTKTLLGIVNLYLSIGLLDYW